MTPEGKVKEAVKNMLRLYKAYYFMPVQAGYGTPGLDFYGCHRGRFFAIETKAPGKRPTDRQWATINMVQAAQGKWFVIDDKDKLQELELWLLLNISMDSGA